MFADLFERMVKVEEKDDAYEVVLVLNNGDKIKVGSFKAFFGYRDLDNKVRKMVDDYEEEDKVDWEDVDLIEVIKGGKVIRRYEFKVDKATGVVDLVSKGGRNVF